uniref:O-linked n-acetylglucosamine transferase, ogt, putative n=1 Tax=Arundo donax TaxID=35708 RepID=A0A0A9HCD6_ARUDO
MFRSMYMFPRFVRACGWFSCNTRHDLKQLIASSTLPASLSALSMLLYASTNRGSHFIA